MRLAQAKVHFIGIGGIGMSGLAELLRNMGGQVSGSDLSENVQTARLKSLGISVFNGHDAANVHGAEVVVYTSAIRPENPELREARRMKIPLIPRAEALAEIMRAKRGVAIGGSHGKTTTTSMAAAIFLHAKAQPTVVVGGRLELIKSTALLGQGEWMIAEADESDGSFSRLSPEIAIVTNIDNDHLDYYETITHLKKAFLDFAMRVPFYGLAIVCGDDPLVRETFRDYGKRLTTYGFERENDFRISGERSEYKVFRDGACLGELRLQIPGRHNALNATAALIAGLEAGFPFEVCAEGLTTFAGVDRRFQHKGMVNGVDVYDDYGHHPTEVEAVLSAFREKFPKRRIVTVFQPHRFSRTKFCWDQFLTCFNQTDRLFVCDIYPAGEEPISEIHSKRLVEAIAGRQFKRDSFVSYLSSSDDRVGRIAAELRSGDVLVTLGDGDIYKLGLSLLGGQG